MEVTCPPRSRLALSDVLIGCSSWTSPAWWDRVYPRRLHDGDRLAWYARRWNVVEVDTSYYRDPGGRLFRRWGDVTPDGFRFTVKFPRDLLDPKQELDAEGVERFLANAAQLGPKLGPILLQFPPWFRPRVGSGFLDRLLDRLDPTHRYAVELRAREWFEGERWSELGRQLRDRRMALAWSYLTYVEVPPERTTDFAYLRFIGDHTTVPAEFHGEVRLDRSAELARWARVLQEALNELGTAFAFFNNHFQGFAPDSVNLFRRTLGLEPVRFAPSDPTLDAAIDRSASEGGGSGSDPTA